MSAALLVLGADPALLGPPRRLTLSPPGFDPRAAWFALLGQSPATRWAGPAPLALAAAGRSPAEDETIYLLSPVRADGVILAETPLSPNQQSDLLEALEESLEDAGLSCCAGPLGPTVTIGDAVAGPPSVVAEQLAGRALSDLPAGPSALLERLIASSARACAQRGFPRGATHLFPHAPAARLAYLPLREAWLGLGKVAFVGGPLARACATLLGGTHWPSEPHQVLAEALARSATNALVIAIEPAPLGPGELRALSDFERLCLVSTPSPGPEGIEVLLTQRGGSLEQPGPDLLRSFANR